MEGDQTDKIIKPFYGNKVIILCIIIFELIFCGFLLFSPFVQSFLYSCFTVEIPENEKILSKIIFFFDTINPVWFIIVITIVISFIVSIVALFILMIKDDCNIRFAKLNELKEIRKEVKRFEEKLDVETIVKETTETSNNQNSDKTVTETTHTNYLYEFYKKYMDSITDL